MILTLINNRGIEMTINGKFRFVSVFALCVLLLAVAFGIHGNARAGDELPYALEFAVEEACVRAPQKQFAEGGEVTVLAWVKINDAEGDHAILFTGAGWGRKGIKFFIRDGEVRFQLGDGTGEAFTRKGKVPAGEWTLIGGMWRDGHIYNIVDDEIMRVAEWSGGHYPNPDFDIYIGQILDQYEMAWSTMDGKIGEVRIYDRAFSEDEIRDIKQQPSTAYEEGLVGQWPLDEGMGSIAYDISGHESHGRIIGANWVKKAPEPVAELSDREMPVLLDLVEDRDQPFGVRMEAARTAREFSLQRDEDFARRPAEVTGVLSGGITWWVGADPHVGRPDAYAGGLDVSVRDVNLLGLSDYAVILGDLVEDDSDYVVDFNNSMNNLLHDWTYILGNHDFEDGELLFPINFFSKVVNGIRIIALSDEDGHGKPGETTIGPAQDQWLQDTLNDNPDVPTIIMTHHSPTSSGKRGRSVSSFDDWLADSIEGYNIVAWFVAHDHIWKIEEDAGGYGFTEVFVNEIIDKNSPTSDTSHGMFMTIEDEEESAKITLKFRDHYNQQWLTIDGHSEYIIEGKTSSEWKSAKEWGNMFHSQLKAAFPLRLTTIRQ